MLNHKNVTIIVEGPDLRFLGIYEKNVQRDIFSLAKLSHLFSYLSLDNVRMYKHADLIKIYHLVQEL